METLNMTWVNLLRKQYLDILDFYAGNKQLLDDKELMKCLSDAAVGNERGRFQAVAKAAERLWTVVHGCGGDYTKR